MPERATREEIDELIVRTREAHEALKDIKAATKELNETIKHADEAQVQLMAALVHVVDEAIGEAIETGLANYSGAITSAIDGATAAVYERFDIIAGILLGETEPEDMEDAARLVRKSMDKNVRLSSVEEWQMEEIHKAVERRLGAPNLRGEKG
jgi:hypothetical protein